MHNWSELTLSTGEWNPNVSTMFLYGTPSRKGISPGARINLGENHVALNVCFITSASVTKRFASREPRPLLYVLYASRSPAQQTLYIPCSLL